MTTQNKPLPPTVRGLREQIEKAIDDKEEKINDCKKTIEARHAETLAKHKQLAVDIEKLEKSKGDPKGFQELIEAHSRNLAVHVTGLENLESDLKAFKKERAALELQLRSPSLAD
jgi:chromosome segregation ATPase